MTKSGIETLVVEPLAKHSIRSVPIPVEKIAAAEGIPIVGPTFNAQISGALFRSRGVNAIAVNNTHSTNRRRFTIAHELGHYLLDHKAGEDHVDWGFTVLRRDGRSSEAVDKHEIEANAFAASLLMPKSELVAEITDRSGSNGELEIAQEEIALLARRYQVSETAMMYRLLNLGLISPT